MDGGLFGPYQWALTNHSSRRHVAARLNSGVRRRMNPSGRFLINLAIPLLVSACGHYPDRPRLDSVPPIQELDASDIGRAGVERSESFLVSYDLEYGYQLWRPSNLSEPIQARFTNPDAENTFRDWEWDSALHLGKRIYCECTGKPYFVDGREWFFEVRHARIFSR